MARLPIQPGEIPSTLNPYQKTEQYNEVVTKYGTGATTSPSTFGGLNAGTVISRTEVKNKDGSITVTTTYADGKGGTYQEVTTIPAPPGSTEDLDRADAFALIESTMRSYGFTDAELKEITDYIQKGMLDPKMGPNRMLLELRNLPSYKARFAGNETRRALGLNVLSESQYLQQERDYSETFRQKGLQRFNSRAQFATLIGNDISNVELGDRVDLAVNRVQYGDPLVLNQLRTYYGITDTDIAAYYLNPKEVLPELEARTTSAEIGAVAAGFGFESEKARAERLRAAGVTLASARTGYQQIASILPRAEELTQFYAPSGIEYNQTTAEEETFKGTASAKRARERLKQLEIGSFSGSSGVGRLANKGIAGTF